MFQQLRDSLRSTPARVRDLVSDAPRPRRKQRPVVESLEGRPMCDGAESTFNNMSGASNSGTIQFDG